MFHTKFYQNQIINQDIEILGGWKGVTPTCIFVLFCLHFQVKLK